MTSFLALEKSLAKRVGAAWVEYLTYALILVAVAQLAIYVALPAEGRLRVGTVDSPYGTPISIPGASLVRVDARAGRVDIAMGRVDAVVRRGADGIVHVVLARSDEVARRVTALCASGAASVAAEGMAPMNRGRASTLMGIWIMFLLVVGVLCGRFFVQDKERGVQRRLAGAPLRPGTYLVAHALFTFFLCFGAPLLMVGVEGAFRGDGLGLDLPGWALVLACTAALASSFALLTDTLFPTEDQAVNVASMTMLFTSLLSGSLVAPRAQGPLLRAVSTIMPQRAIMRMVDGLEAGGMVDGLQLALVLSEAVALGLGAYLITARRLREGKG